MKKVVSLLMAALLLLTMTAFAEMDFTSMSDDELHALIDGARLELQKRELVANGETPLFEVEGVSLFFTGEIEFTGASGKMLAFTAIIVNDSEKNINIRTQNLAVNGWSFNATGFSDIPAGQKKKGKMTFSTDGEITTVEEITDLVADFSIVNKDDTKDVIPVGNFTIHFNEE